MSRSGPPQSLPNSAEQAKADGLMTAADNTPILSDLLAGLPAIPVEEETEHYPDVPEEALAHVPWL